MKMIYQQLLAFFLVIACTILLLGFSFGRMSKTFVYDQTWHNLEKYSDSLIQQSLTISSRNKAKVTFNEEKLKNSEALLENQAVHFTVFSPKDQVIYPNNGVAPRITRHDWEHLRRNQIVRKVNNKNFKLSNGKTRPAMIEVLKPYYYKKKLVAAVTVGAFISDVNSNVKRINRDLLKALFVALLISMFISYFIARRLNRRISKLRSSANQVSNGNYKICLKPGGKDEIGELIVDFNHMTQSLQQANNEIQRQEERRQEFLANAAHEMRTPLTTISGILEGIKYDVIPQESRAKSIDLMSSETQRLIRLVNENLDYEKIRSNSIQLDKHQFNAAKVLENVIDQLDSKAEESRDKLVLNAPKSLTIYADYDRFVQIVFNIVTNAIQFTDQGTITVTGERGYNETIIKVADTGIGMSEDQQKNIFERYYKADASRRTGKYGESGLGLAIVHQLVKSHGGKISVSSKLGEGTTFTVIIPDATAAEKDQENQ